LGERDLHALSEILVSPQKLGVDCADLIEDIAQLVQRADRLLDTLDVRIANIISAGTAGRLADGKIVLRTMAGTIRAMTIWPAAAKE
jgi:hypothetical protein